MALMSAAASLVAIWLGWNIADESYGLPSLVIFVLFATTLVRAMRLPFDVILLGLVVAGYIVGNRGFAQLMPASYVPLLPAELTLLVAGSWLIIGSAHDHRLPWEHDPLNWTILAWLALGSARLLFDVRSFGFIAIRDFAMVYYAMFFFIAQRMARSAGSRRFLVTTLLAAAVLALPSVILSNAFPVFFLTQLTVHGVPLIYYKGDLAYTFIGTASLLVFFAARGPHRYWAWPVATILFLYVAAGDNRASLLGLVAAVFLLLLARRWHFAAVQGTATIVGLAIVTTLSVVFGNAWAGNKLQGVSDRVHSLADLEGLANYQSEDSSNKGDNNRFRLVWWKNVVEETWHSNPVFGLGFGYDLAHSFVQEYYPDAAEEFTTRSPHNIFLSVFGRLGLTGFAVWLALGVALLRATWRSLRQDVEPVTWALWCSVWVLLISATFGVVLEGPMGAVPFWTILGLAHGQAREATAPAAEVATPVTAALHDGGVAV
jgi:O-antigen ligase